MKQLLEAIKAKYLCLHDWEVIYRVEYIDGWKILLKCKKCGKLRKRIFQDTQDIMLHEMVRCIVV